MTDKKKAADFVVEVDTSGKTIIAQLVCDVKGAMRSVIGRKEIRTVKEFQDAVMLAKNQALAISPDQPYRRVQAAVVATATRKGGGLTRLGRRPRDCMLPAQAATHAADPTEAP